MKRIIIPMLVFLGLAGCQSMYHKVEERKDTVQILFRQIDNSWLIDSAVRVIKQVKKEKDSGSMELVWMMDTSYYLAQIVDTDRDARHRPIYDSAHKVWKPRFAFSPYPIPDSMTPKYLTLISSIPFHHPDTTKH